MKLAHKRTAVLYQDFVKPVLPPFRTALGLSSITVTPRRPRVEGFFPFTAKARVCASAFVDDGTHIDTEFQLLNADTDVLVSSGTVGPVVNFTLNATLAAGVSYQVRVRYYNEAGGGLWSPWHVSTVEAPPLLNAAIPVITEPVALLALPIEPDYITEPVRRRSMYDLLLQTGHRFRRPEHSLDRYGVRMTWRGLDQANRDTLLAFIEARLDADPPEGFLTAADELGAVGYFTRQGAYEVRQTAPAVWEIELEADQVRAPAGAEAQFFTIGESTIGGDDVIR